MYRVYKTIASTLRFIYHTQYFLYRKLLVLVLFQHGRYGFSLQKFNFDFVTFGVSGWRLGGKV
jgi:hypothetical protein